MPCRMMQQVIINSLLLGWAHQKYLKKKRIIQQFLKKGLVKRIPFASQNMAKFQQKKSFLHSNGITYHKP